MISEELLKVLIENNTDPKSLSKHLFAEINRVKSIRRSIEEAKEKKYKALEEYELKCANADEEIKKVQNGCKHEVKSYNPDPAGGRDSWYDCDICGKVI